MAASVAVTQEVDGAEPSAGDPTPADMDMFKLPAGQGRKIKRRRFPIDFPVQLGAVVDGLTMFKVINQGAFGTVYEALDLKNAQTYALKVETVRPNKKSFLKVEATIYKAFCDKRDPNLLDHICKFYHFGKAKMEKDGVEIRFAQLDMLGKNLEELKIDSEEQTFSAGCVGEIGKQCLNALKALHTIGYVFRDVKPTNFAIGRSLYHQGKIFLFDFGLSLSYAHSDGSLRTPRFKGSTAGTARYWSIQAHSAAEMGRVDDLWALYYMLLEQYLGALPWDNQEDVNLLISCKRTLLGYFERAEEKRQKEIPAAFKNIYEYLETLNTVSEPDYNLLNRWFDEMKWDDQFKQLPWIIPTKEQLDEMLAAD